MGNKLTDRGVWENYWHSYRFGRLPAKSFYHAYLPQESRNKRFIEIGGFPGLNAYYFYKYVCDHITILDYYIDKEIISKIETENNVPPDTIDTIEADFFNFSSPESYDIVFSTGFIEHFVDTEDVIKRHIDLLKQGGDLLIILPNLRGLNGLIQYLFDKENLNIHNLQSMDKKRLEDILKKYHLKNIKVEYLKKPMVWLEPKKGFLNKVGRILVKGVSYLIKLFPIRSWFLSPYIILSAKK